MSKKDSGFRKTLFGIVAVGLLLVGLAGGAFYGQTGSAALRASNDVFSPAHETVGQAIRHFFWIRQDPVQPIAFVHSKHIQKVELECTDCHTTVGKGPKAGIPDVRTCWSCHAETLTDHPEIQKLTAYFKRGEDIPWQRVYGWTDEAHVRFNHAPHIRATVQCSTCHGDVASMNVAQRVVDHSMGFCVDCHKQRQAPNDCTTCHF